MLRCFPLPPSSPPSMAISPKSALQKTKARYTVSCWRKATRLSSVRPVAFRPHLTMGLALSSVVIRGSSLRGSCRRTHKKSPGMKASHCWSAKTFISGLSGPSFEEVSKVPQSNTSFFGATFIRISAGIHRERVTIYRRSVTSFLRYRFSVDYQERMRREFFHAKTRKGKNTAFSPKTPGRSG